MRALLRQIQSAIGEVYPLSLEQWEDGFRCDTNPSPEIAHWLHLSRVYTNLVTSGRLASKSFAERRAIFNMLTACGIDPPAQMPSITDYQPLTRADAEAVIAAFFLGSDGPSPLSALSVG